MEFGSGDASEEGPAANLMEISRVLEETARLIREHALSPARPRDAPIGRVGVREVRAVLALRGLRREYLGHNLSEAAWAMMLELYAARLEDRLVYQTQLGVLAGLPHTTALATVRRLVAQAVFVSAPHPEDKRLLVIALGDETADRLGRYIAAAYRIAPL